MRKKEEKEKENNKNEAVNKTRKLGTRIYKKK